MIFNKNQYDARCVLRDTVPVLAKHSKYLPIFKYLKDIGVNSLKSYKETGYDLTGHLPQKSDHYKTTAYSKAFNRDAKGLTPQEIVNKFLPQRAACYLTHVSKKDFDSQVVLQFLSDNIDGFKSGQAMSTSLRKLACYYDFHVYGWDIKR